MDDKDRLGDKLRDKGKAAEDLYIAQQEQLRLQRLRAAAVTSAGTGACPRDGTKLDQKDANGVTIDVCPTCEGMWLDKGEVEHLAKHENESQAVSWVRSLFGR